MFFRSDIIILMRAHTYLEVKSTDYEVNALAMLSVPDQVYKSVTEIEPRWLIDRGITLLLADLDNTLTRYGQPDPDSEVLAWRETLRRAGVELFLLSNSRRPSRVAHYAKVLDIPALGHSGKPSPKGFQKAMEQMGRGPDQTAMVGDQIFTDILGAKRAGITALLVEPIELGGNPGRYLRYAVESPFRSAGKRREKT